MFHFVEVCHRASQCVTTCGSVLLVCCGVLLHFLEGVAACFGVLQCVAVCYSVLQCVARLLLLLSTVLQIVAVCFTGFQSAAVCCIVLQCVAVCCSCSVVQCAHQQAFPP